MKNTDCSRGRTNHVRRSLAVWNQRLAAVERAVAELRALPAGHATTFSYRLNPHDPLVRAAAIWKKPPPEELAKLEAEVDPR